VPQPDPPARAPDPAAPAPGELDLDEAPLLLPCAVVSVGGARAFRRRLLELGVLPGVPIQKTRVAPLGDPLEIEVRGASLSLRRAEARCVQVRPAAAR
jgi:ferrous iron transport protein A